MVDTLTTNAEVNTTIANNVKINTNPIAWMDGEAVTLAGNTYTTYATLADALTPAVSGESVLLAKDVTAESLTVKPGVTMDLSGNKLTATEVTSAFDGAHIIDSTGAGKLVADSVSMATGNNQLPVKVNGEHSFENVEFKTDYKTENNKAIYRFYIKGEAAQTLIDDAIVAGEAVSLEVVVKWKNANGEAKEKTFVLGAELLAQLAANWDSKAVVLTINDISSVEILSCTAQVVSGDVIVTA